MDNILQYPTTTWVDRNIPKNTFYQRLNPNNKIKQLFVQDILSIQWLYKIAHSTLNIQPSNDIPEIDIFLITLKTTTYNPSLIQFIDQNIPHHLIFIIQYQSQFQLLTHYKTWTNQDHSNATLIDTFATTWHTRTQLSLPLNGLNTAQIYDTFIRHIAQPRLPLTSQHTLIHDIKNMQTRETLQKQLATLQYQLHKEKQPQRQFMLHQTILSLKQQLHEI